MARRPVGVANAAAFAIAAAFIVLSAAGAGAITVIGTGDPAQDVPAVQAAVDQGGTVVLSGTFEFGTHAGNHIIVPGRAGADQDVRGQSTVFIYQTDVTISGERDGNGNLLTIIRNGMPAFWIGWDGNTHRTPPGGTPGVDYGIETFPQDVDGRVRYRDTGPEPGYLGDQTRYAVAFPQVSATIRDIRFDSPQHYGIKGTCGRNLSIMNNVVSPVGWGGLIHMNGFAGATHIACGMGVLGRWYPPFVEPAMTGSIIYSGNRIEDSGTEIINTHQGECFGCLGFMTTASLEITGNTIRNVGRDENGAGPNTLGAGIFFCDNHTGAAVLDNTIHNASDYGLWLVGGYVPAPRPLIAGNFIGNCPRGVSSQNIFSSFPGCDFRQNIVRDCILGCYFGGNGATWATDNNTVVGSGTYGISHAVSAIVTSFAGNIVTGGTGVGVQLPSATDPAVVRCNDVWSNGGGNWLGIADPSGANGNFSMDPLFCNPILPDYSLQAASPCLPGNHPQGADCDTIGALGQGCLSSGLPGLMAGDRAGDRAATTFSLLGPWPNPSRDLLRFGVVLSRPSSVRVTLFDVNGRTVAVPLEGWLSAGYHGVSRELREYGIPALGSGIYYLRLEAAGLSQTTKLVLAR